MFSDVLSGSRKPDWRALHLWHVLNPDAGNLTLVELAGANTVSSGSARTFVFDGAGGNAYAGGTGTLLIVSAPTVPTGPADTIAAGSGEAVAFGGDGSNIVFRSPIKTASVFVAGAGNETVDASGNAGRTYVFGNVGGALTVQGRAGALSFIGSGSGSPSSTILAGRGQNYIYGSTTDSISLIGQASPAGSALFVAGAGNETLDGNLFSGASAFFANNPPSSVAGSMVNTSIVGGNGNDSLPPAPARKRFSSARATMSFSSKSRWMGWLTPS